LRFKEKNIMSGRSANESISAAKATIKSLYMGVAGVGGSEEETSKIGGEGRKGGDAEGRLEAAPHHRPEEMMGGSGMATTGQTGYNSGFGKKLGS
jgi:hypothetical protein